MGRRLGVVGLALLALGLLDVAAPHVSYSARWAQAGWDAVVVLPMLGVCVAALFVVGVGRGWLVVAGAAALVAFGLAAVGAPSTVLTLAKLVCAAAIGFVLAREVRAPVELVVIAVAIAVSDVVSVLRGPSAIIASHHPAVFDALTLQFHALGSRQVSALGMTDVVFFAGFVAAASAIGFRVWRTWLFMTASFSVTSVIAFSTGRLVPALPLLAAAAMLANVHRLTTTRRRRTTAGSDDG